VNWPAYLENISIKGIAGFSVIALESGPIPGYYMPPAFEGQNNNWASCLSVNNLLKLNMTQWSY